MTFSVFSYTVLYFLVALLCAAIGMIIASHLTIDMGSGREISFFRMFVICFTVFCLTNAVWVWINYGYLKWNGTANSMVNLIAICACAYYWFCYVSVKIDAKQTEGRIFRLVSLVPLLLVIALVGSTPFTRLVFYYNAENEYIHGPLYVAMVGLAMFYLLIASLRIMRRLFVSKSYTQRREYRVLLAFLFYPLAGGVVDALIPNLPIMELTMMAGIVTVFTSMQGSRVYHDPLTGLYNRRRADEYLAEQIAFVSEREPLYFFIADADRFKMINDRYGHVEGDRALQIIADALRDATVSLDGCVARWGGDEFAVILEHRMVSAPETIVTQIEKALETRAREAELPYPLRLSIGYTVCKSDSILGRELFRRADQMMYSEKEQKRGQTGGAGI